MTDPKEPVHPSVNETKTYELVGGVCTEFFGHNGITKRELFASMAMQGLCANPAEMTVEFLAKQSVEIADKLIIALNKEKDV